MSELAAPPALLTFRVTVCRLCLSGEGEECWVPGCAFWCAPVPDDEVVSRLLLAFTNDDEAEEWTDGE